MTTKTTMHPPFILTVVALLAVIGMVKADDPNVEILKKLYTKISDDVGVGNPQIAAGNEFLVLANPGILIDPRLDMTKAEDRYKLANVLDKILIPDFIYKTKNERSLDLYKGVLDYKEAPVYTIPPEAKAQLDQARADIFVNGERKKGYTQAFKDFRDKRLAFATANDLVTQYKAIHPNEAVPEAMWAALQNASEDYDLIGQKYVFIAEQATLNQWAYQGVGPRFVKIGRFRRYPAADLEAWLASRPDGGSRITPDAA